MFRPPGTNARRLLPGHSLDPLPDHVLWDLAGIQGAADRGLAKH